MAAQQDRGRADDALFIADVLLAQNKVSRFIETCNFGDNTILLESEDNICMNCSRVGHVSASSHNAHFLSCKAKQAKGKATSACNKCNVRWVEKDAEGCPLLKRSRRDSETSFSYR